MKKTYQKPEIETAELHLHTAIMSSPGENTQESVTDPNDPFGGGGAPKRRVF